MAQSKATKQALYSSILSLLLCTVMFVGTTYAWFTDRIESGYNRIQTGNLEVELDYYTDNNGQEISSKNFSEDKWKAVDKTTKLFEKDTWSPGDYRVVYLRVKNTGKLNLKYQLYLNLNETEATIQLSDKIKIEISELGNPQYTVSSTTQDSSNNERTTNTELAKAELKKGDTSKIFKIEVSMPGSTTQSNSTTSTIKLGVILKATQTKSETESESKSQVETSTTTKADEK